jgi:hypothetical protein
MHRIRRQKSFMINPRAINYSYSLAAYVVASGVYVPVRSLETLLIREPRCDATSCWRPMTRVIRLPPTAELLCRRPMTCVIRFRGSREKKRRHTLKSQSTGCHSITAISF